MDIAKNISVYEAAAGYTNPPMYLPDIDIAKKKPPGWKIGKAK